MIWSNILVDIFLVAVVCSGFVFGAKRGIISVIRMPMRLLSSFVLAAVASVTLSSAVVMPLIKDPIISSISEKVVAYYGKNGEVPGLLKLMKVTPEMLASGTESVAAEIIEPAILVLSVIVTFFVTYLFGKIAIGIVLGLLNMLLSIGPLKKFSKISGAVIGILVFFVFATIIAKIFGLCISLGVFSKLSFFDGFDGGFVFDFMENVWKGFFGF